jgi:hypothetical protein
MAESTLAITYDDLRAAIGNYLAIGMDTTAWNTEETAQVEMIIKSALRQFYFPPPVQENGMLKEPPHDWSFLKPVVTLDTIAPYSTGTIAIDNGATTVTLTTGVWPAWTATHGSLVVDTAEYVIATRTDDTHLELAVAWAEDTETAAEYVLKHDGNYDLPDDFAGIQGTLVIESVSYKPNVALVGEGVIRTSRQQAPQNMNSGSTTTPYLAAVRPKVHETTTVGQRFEIMFYPLPNDVYTISYKKIILPNMLVDTTIEYPYGGAEHAETLRAACIAVAEEQENGNRLNGSPVFDKKKLFEERLAASIQMDKLKDGVEYFGYSSDNSDIIHQDGPMNTNDRRYNYNRGLVTYDGGL